MHRCYLVVAHRTATSPELIDRCRELAEQHWEACFSILVPASESGGGMTVTVDTPDGEALARQRAAEARERFEEAGLVVESSRIGAPSPVQAIEDELTLNPDHYHAIVLSTLPPGISRWLGMDVHRRAERRFDLPLIHVVAEPAAAMAD